MGFLLYIFYVKLEQKKIGSFEYSCNFRYQWIIWIWITKYGANRLQHLRDMSVVGAPSECSPDDWLELGELFCSG